LEADEARKDQPEEKGSDIQQADPDTEKMISTLRRTDTAPSLASAVLKEKAAARDAEEKTEYAFFYAFGRMARINRDAKWLYLCGCLGATVGGMVFPVFGIIYGES
jgi:ATP-binding cassette subfamily B (MDR/TAP) protein 1